ncbi:hypothetical protein CP967_08685 [Streptomyces nitrosporeus]|uniref:Uncharacterized protein n=1 Tax=Streptomyces nitrosporeus TaxID=28894 RepID=A0A5J6F6Q5_9ACTN|nr:hypothetical protein [Streptomyces nitrosporeus]QEU72038.1 hypothetical protein CP967_08685 [Streptomyces nitrosporeus]GGY81072.1 hypothetical protein GCM10010327_09630 [Streptomyces nitrosporeus]
MTTTPRTWASGETPTGATFNAEIRDQWNSVLDAWTAYTPAWTGATSNPVYGNAVVTGRYMKVGRTCHVRIDISMGSTTTYGSGGWALSLPFTSAATGSQVGDAHVLMSARIAGHINVGGGATVGQIFFPTSGSPHTLSWASATVPVTWAAGARLTIALTYETAT